MLDDKPTLPQLLAAGVIILASVVLSTRKKEEDIPPRKRSHTKDYSNGPGLFGKHHGTYQWGPDEES